jgi:hypothetical protein
MKYHNINNLLGWLCFVTATATYVLTLEPSVSFWDCGEFIACAYRLQVSHQPGYPMFAMLGKVFSLLALGNTAKVPYFTNLLSAIASGATIMFLFWTITALAKKMLVKQKDAPLTPYTLALIMGAGLVGALAFTYTDTFWFSAVETIVFAVSSFCTALVFWAILKWEAHADEPGADRWLIFIAYVIGLSIGIHLLNLLTIPAIAMVYYFRRYQHHTFKNGLLAFLTGLAILALVQFGIRTYTVKLAAYFDLFFVNSLGFGFGSGAGVFLLLLAGLLAAGIVYSIRKRKPVLNLALLCVVFVYLGNSSFVYIPIRAAAGTNLNNAHPDNAFTLYGYLNRIQYISPPLLYGQYFDGKVIEAQPGSTLYRKGKTQYENYGKSQNYVYDHNTLLPRMYSNDNQDPQFYRQWLGMGENDAPTFGDNLRWMFSWQMNTMYWRYFMWNFAGRYSQDDFEGQTDPNSIKGGWTTGLFDKGHHIPASILNDTNYTPLYALPLIIGLLGLAYHVRKNKKDALVIALLFFFTGLAIVIYVNQPSIQPRERDYSYVCSFYAFAIWIGLGVIAMAELLRKKAAPQVALVTSVAVCLLAAPVLMARQEWSAHDRSTKWIPHDMAYNYLISCPPNAILFTEGDNQTYSLWYDQEVEGIRPDVRIVNLSLLGADWSIRQMQRPINKAAALPITMPYDKYKSGVRDFIPFSDAKLAGYTGVKEVFDFITSDDPRTMVEFDNGETGNYLPTKNFKLDVDAQAVVKNKVISPAQQSHLTRSLEWTYNNNFITKEHLAMIDILAHNNWKRPICFVDPISSSLKLGMQPYFYREGMASRLIPLQKDTAATSNGQPQINSLVMYNNVMNKFKWGNFKHARYLDPEARNTFYPLMVAAFADLTQGLLKENRQQLALNALHKYEQVLPEINPNLRVADSKIFLADSAYKLKYAALGDKLVKGINTYVTEQLDYYHSQLQKDAAVDKQEVQNNMYYLNSLVNVTRANHQTQLSAKLEAQLVDYENKFGSLMRM